ncbi:MAG TPA: hypothetical protein VN618_14555 [Solirubrobacteraceae bacterium]|nr:hypothetical protein [Solirubrobacteraceae bacterium]
MRIRGAIVLAIVAALTAGSMTLAAGSASAAAPPSSTDVMFVFDTSGSMTGELEEAKEKISSVMAALAASLPNVAFGVSRVEDVPDWNGQEYLGGEPTEKEFEENTEKAWELLQPMSTDQGASQAAINRLTIGSGGDLPESYGRALYEADTNPNVAWRAGARHEIVLIADNVPHDENLNQGLAEALWGPNEETGNIENPFNTGKEAPGKQGIPGTTWGAKTNLQIIPIAQMLAADGKPLEDVEFFGGAHGYLHYWEYWAGLSGGSALDASSGELASKLTTLIEGGACGTTCPHPTVTQVICNLVIATASDTCTATVADAAGIAAKNPTGAVGFGSSSGGTFLGNSCTLTPTPASPNTSSCSVTYLPPTTASSLPSITATYAGDAAHNGSAGKTTYPPASELAKDVDFSEAGTIHEGEVEVPFECGFPCLMAGELFTGPDLGTISSTGSVQIEVAEAAGRKKKKHTPKLLGKGSAKLKTAGKGKLVIKISRKYRSKLAHMKGTLHLTIKFTTKTANGTVVGRKTVHVKLKPKKVKKKKH